jgi:hypothetical protein
MSTVEYKGTIYLIGHLFEKDGVKYVDRVRQCGQCGDVTIHPIIWCEKCGGQFRPVIMKFEDFMEIVIKRRNEDQERADKIAKSLQPKI